MMPYTAFIGTKAAAQAAAKARRRIASIARRELLIDSLKTRHSDALDFHDRHVSRVRSALEEAWRDGFATAIAIRITTTDKGENS